MKPEEMGVAVRRPTMKFKSPGIVAIAGFLIGAGLLMLSTRRSGVLSIVFACYGQLFVNLAWLDYVFTRDAAEAPSTMVVRHAKDAIGELTTAVVASLRNCLRLRQDLAWLAAAMGIGIAVRGYSLTQPMSYDESYTFLYFVRRGFPGLLVYTLPNNHILHTILVRVSTMLLGSYPASIRAPAFLAGVTTIPLTFCLCRKVVPERSGYFASIAMAVLPYMVLYSTVARGYSLLVALTLTLALIGLHVVERPTLGGCGLLALIGALGMLTMPSMLFALGGVHLWLGSVLFVARRSVWAVVREFLIPCGALTLLFTLVLYTPSIIESGGVRSIVANEFVQPVPWNAFVAALSPHFWRIASGFAWDLPQSLLVASALLVLVGMLGAAYERNWAVILLAPSMVVGSGTVFLLKQRIPFVRTWIYAIPFVLVLADAGLSYVTKWVPRRLQCVVPLLMMSFGMYHAGIMMSEDVIALSADFPEASAIVQKLKEVIRSGDVVDVKLPADLPTRFYMWYYGLPDSVTPSDTGHTNRLFVVDKRSYAVTDMTHEPVALVAEYGQAALYRTLDVEPVGTQ